MYTPRAELVAPDMFVFTPLHSIPIAWVEAKHKSVFSWYRIGQCWETGIDIRHYEDYCRIADHYPFPVYLMFLHSKDRDPDPKFSRDPWPCPTGLFGHNLTFLRQNESHRSPLWGNTGMVYWKHQDLYQLATLHEVTGG